MRNENGEYELLTGNETGLLLLDYVCSRRLALGNMPENPVLITFDDGYRDNYTNAFPLLKKYEKRQIRNCDCWNGMVILSCDTIT